jgi:hypothetical protein
MKTGLLKVINVCRRYFLTEVFFFKFPGSKRCVFQKLSPFSSYEREGYTRGGVSLDNTSQTMDSVQKNIPAAILNNCHICVKNNFSQEFKIVNW